MQLSSLFAEARSIQDWIVYLRREIHQHPELRYEEVKTSALVQKTLEELSIPFQYPLAETGVLATIGNGNGPCVALRADMDALPMPEESGVPFSSKVEGRMHACGHDCHVAMLLGAARLLKQRESEISGTVKLIFQPAEEGGAGGERMRDAGVLESPKVDHIFGLHVWPWVDTGKIAGRAGAFMAGVGSFEIIIDGKGGHGAMPHLTFDPISTAAKVVCELQTVVSRETSPLESSVLSVTSINGGEAFNVIPASVRLLGTIRSFSQAGMQFLKQRIQEIATHIAAANRCEAQVDFSNLNIPATINEANSWTFAQTVGQELLGEGSVQEIEPVMGGEDFSYYLEKVPGCFIGLGIRNESKGTIYSIHDSRFLVDEDALPIGTALHVALALRSLGRR